MKKSFTLLFALLTAIGVFAQLPEKMSYQAVIRNSGDALVTNTQIGMQISILQGSASGTEVYVETQTPTTNANGLVSVEIGTGTTSDNFSSIDWANGPYFIKTETDPEGGTGYTITGTSQLLSVPYALHAKTAETVTGGISETDPVYSQSVAAGITTVDTAGWNAKMDSYTETDSIYLASEAAKITSADITNLGNLSGINTGDQDITGIATNQQAIKNIRANMLTSEIDPIYAADSATINASIATNTQAIIDTALQLRTDLATKEALIDTTSLLHSEIATNQQAIIDTASQLRTDLATKVALTDTAAVLHGEIATNQQAIIDTASQLRTDLATKVALTDTAAVFHGKIATNQQAIIDTAAQLRTDLAPKVALTDTAAVLHGKISTNQQAIIDTASQLRTDLATKVALTDTAAVLHGKIATNQQAIIDTAANIRGAMLTSESDPDFNASVAAGITTADTAGWNAKLDSYTETDPIYVADSATTKQSLRDWNASIAKTISAIDTANWNNKLDSYTETDPVYGSSVASGITGTDTTNWNNKQDQLTAGTGIDITGNVVSVTTYSVGDFAQGGIVFWVDETGQHGLVCAKVDQNSGIQWYNGNSINTEAHGDGIYAGEMNTMLIIARQGSNSNGYAAGVCANYTVTESGITYGDWYLPSKEELNLMTQNKTAIDATAEANGGSSFASGRYWSSMEYANSLAWSLNIFDGGSTGYNGKQISSRVRAIRAF